MERVHTVNNTIKLRAHILDKILGNQIKKSIKNSICGTVCFDGKSCFLWYLFSTTRSSSFVCKNIPPLLLCHDTVWACTVNGISKPESIFYISVTSNNEGIYYRLQRTWIIYRSEIPLTSDVFQICDIIFSTLNMMNSVFLFFTTWSIFP